MHNIGFALNQGIAVRGAFALRTRSAAVLAAVIATAGVITDSTATVIGAMIVAPLMTPILGMVLSVVTVDARNLAVSLLLVATGACAVVALGWLL